MSKYYDPKQLPKEPINIIYGSVMTKEEKNKYAYELMIKNNPDEAVKNLMLLDKSIEKVDELQHRIDKAIEYIENYKHEYYYDLVDKKEILDILRGEDNESN